MEAATAAQPTSKATSGPVAKVKSKAAWTKRAVHTPILPSGSQVTIVIPNLPALLKAGEIPNELLNVALKNLGGEELTEEDAKAAAEFNEYIVAVMVKEPEIEQADVSALPYEDVQMLVEFATRQRDTDALGYHLAGLETTDEWKKFREEQRQLASAVFGEAG